jgi:AAA15 family ATPase/GTPase
VLIRFGFGNHLSFANYAEITFVAAKSSEEGVDLLRYDSTSPRILPALLVYGANASGKTNVIHALAFMRSAILQSHSSGSPTGGIPRLPFSLDPALATAPSVFDIDFVVEGVRYHYGFECNNEILTQEWL